MLKDLKTRCPPSWR